MRAIRATRQILVHGSIAAQKALEHRVPVLAGDRLGMKLHAHDPILPVLNRHDLPIVARRGDDAERGRAASLER